MLETARWADERKQVVKALRALRDGSAARPVAARLMHEEDVAVSVEIVDLLGDLRPATRDALATCAGEHANDLVRRRCQWFLDH